MHVKGVGAGQGRQWMEETRLTLSTCWATNVPLRSTLGTVQKYHVGVV